MNDKSLDRYEDPTESESFGTDATDPNASLTSLARLAVDSGGRFTERTNDLGRGVTNARRDLSCVYSLGFYENNPEEGRIRNAVVRVRRPGVQVLHAAKFVHRSPSARRESMIRAGFLGQSSDLERVRAKLYPLRPLSGSRWDGVLAVSFDMSADAASSGDLERDFGGVLYNGSRVTHKFDRRVTLKRSSVGSGRRVVYLEPLSIKPGQHNLQVVVSNPVTGEDEQVRVEIEIPEVPRDRLFVVGPILGRRAGSDLVLRADASAESDTVGRQSSFAPLLTNRVARSEDLLALTQVCRVETRKASARAAGDTAPVLHRELLGADGVVVGQLPDVDLDLGEPGRIRCQNLLDLIPTSSLRDGRYAFRIMVGTPGRGETSEAEVSFEVGAAQSVRITED